MDKFERTKHAFLRLGDMEVHPEIQRKFNKTWANKIAENFDPDLFGWLSVIEVKRGGSTRYLIFSGQHRWHAAVRVLGPNQRVPCEIFDDVDLHEQAKIFLGQAQTLPIKSIDKWPLRIKAGDQAVLDIEKILARHKLEVYDGKKAGAIRAVAALETVYSRFGGNTLDRVLGILNGAWGGDPDAYDNIYLRALGYLCYKANGEFDDDEMVRKVAKSIGSVRLIGQARAYAKATGMSVERAMCAQLVELYNRRRHKSKLELDS